MRITVLAYAEHRMEGGCGYGTAGEVEAERDRVVTGVLREDRAIKRPSRPWSGRWGHRKPSRGRPEGPVAGRASAAPLLRRSRSRQGRCHAGVRPT